MTAQAIARALRASAFGLFAVLGTIHAAQAQTAVSGAIAEDTRWTLAQSPYLVTADVTLVANAKLTIEPGVQVYFAPGRNLVVSAGAISAVGSAEAPILFSSKNVLDGLPSARGEWGQLRFLDGNRDADTRLDHVVVEHGHGLEFVAASARVDHVTLRANAGAAIRVDLRSSPVGVGNLASDNDLDAIAVPAGTIAGDLTWGLRGIQYLVASGAVAVGGAPVLASVSPQTAQVGETVDVTLSGSGLTGLDDLAFDRPGVTATLTGTPDASSAGARFVIAEDAAPGPLKLTARTDAGDVALEGAFSIAPRQPKLLSIAPTQVYLGQGDSVIDINGSAFVAGTEALLDGTPLSTTVVAPDHATAVVPSQSTTGTRQVSLRTPDSATPGSFFTTTSLPLQVLSPTLAVTPDVVNAQVGQVATFKVVLPYAAPAGGLVVNLSTSNLTVATVNAASVTVPAGATEKDFAVTAKALGTASVRASRSGYVQGSASLVVTLPPQLSFAPPVLNVAIGTALPATLQLAPAPTVDTVVTLASANPAIATAPTQLTVPAGSASMPLAIDGLALGQTSVTASTAGYGNGTLTVSVAPKAILLPSTAVVAPNATRTLALALNAPAPAGGLVVALSSSNPAVLTVPASVTVAEGQSSATIAGIAGVANGTAVLSASAGGFAAASTTFTVRTIYVYVSANSGVPTGMSVPVSVSISEAAPAGGIGVDLVLDKPALASLSSTHVDIPTGSTSANTVKPQLTALGTGTVRITPSAPGLTPFSADVSLIGPPVVSARYSNYGVVPSVGKGLILKNAYVSLSYPAPTALTVTLTSSQPDKVSVPATVSIPAGGTSVNFDVRGLELTTGTATITATAPGYDASATQMSIDVLPALPKVYYQDTIRTLTSAQDDIYVELGTERPTGQQVAAAPITVGFSLATAAPVGIVAGFTDGGSTIKSEFVIPAGGYYTYVYVSTPTSVGSYSVKAEIAGGGSVIGPVTQVVRPKLYFSTTTVKAVKGFKIYNSYYVTLQRETMGGTPATTVYLTSSDPSRLTVPDSVNFNSGQTSARFEIVGVDYADDAHPITIDASAAGYDSPAEKLMATVIDPVFVLDFNPTLAVGQERPYVWVNVTNGLDYVSAMAPVDVSLAVVDSDPAGIIPGIYAGSSGTEQVTTRQIYQNGSGTSFYLGSPTQLGSFRLQLTPVGYPGMVSGPIVVKPPRLYFDMTKTPVIGKSLQSRVCVYLQTESGAYLYSQAPLVVTVSSSDPGKVQAPAPFTIPAGSRGACDNLAGVELTNGTAVTVDASAPGFEPPLAKLSATVVPVTWKVWSFHSCGYFSCSSNQSAYYMTTPVFSGERYGPVYFTAFMNGVSANAGWGLAEATLPLSLIDATPAGLVPGFLGSDGVTAATGVRMPTGGNGTLYVDKPTQAGSYKIGVQLPDGSVVPSTAVTVIQDALVIGNGNATLQLGTNTTRDVRIRRSSSSVTGEILSAACVDTTRCTVVPATAPTKYSNSGAYADFTLTGVGEGQTLLSATLPSLPPKQVSVEVDKPVLQLFGMPATVAVGGTVDVIVALRTPDGTTLFPTASRTLTLTLSAPGIASVPATVTYPTGTNYVYVTIRGVAKGTVDVTVSEPGSYTRTGSVTVN
jgi:hypothetical protein